MSKTEQKIVQYLTEAHATEQALVTVLQSQLLIERSPRSKNARMYSTTKPPIPAAETASTDMNAS